MIKSMTRSSVLTRTDYRSMLAGNEAFSPGAYELISTTVLGTATATVSFTSIPQFYKHLQIRFVGVPSTNGGGIGIYPNNDRSANAYSFHRLSANGGSVSSGGTGSVAYLQTFGFHNGMQSGVPAAAVIDILDYANLSKNRVIRSMMGSAASSPELALASGAYYSSSSISSLVVETGLGNFSIGSRFSLYGIKG